MGKKLQHTHTESKQQDVKSQSRTKIDMLALAHAHGIRPRVGPKPAMRNLLPPRCGVATLV
eukprot:SAG22_NODE_16986_length_313_cov_1.205607_1_plen_60_part_01